ncbi:MAG: ABC transporter permease [Planctomycetia bacterium]|nr:ABC transporter permease [Planctomycetia bacterium]
MTLWRFSLREVKKRPGRAILTLIAIVIGVATVVSVMMSVGVTRRAYADMFRTINGRAALEISPLGGGMVHESAIPVAAKAPGVKAAVPVLQRRMKMTVGESQTVGVNVLGIDPAVDLEVRDYELELPEGQEWNASTRGLVLESNFAETLGVKIGDEVGVTLRVREVQVPVVGLMRAKGAAGFRAGGLVLMPMKLARQLANVRQRVDSVQIVLSDDANEEKVRQDLQSKMAAHIQKLKAEAAEGEAIADLAVRRPPDRSQQAEETILASEMGLRMATALSIAVAFFMILNTFKMNVGERRRQLSIMRAIGATRGQLSRMVITEGLVMGFAGTLLGVGLGLVGAYYLTRVMESFFRVALPALEFSWLAVLGGAGCGVGVALLGSYWPAREAGKLSPLEGMGNVAKEDREPVPYWVTILALLDLAGALFLLVASLTNWFGFDVSAAASILLLVGVVLLIPGVLGPVSGAVARLLAPVLRIEGRLAHGQIVRRRTRTSLTVGVLFVAIGTGTGTASLVLDNINDVRDWYQRSLTGDFLIRSAMPDFTSNDVPELPPDFVAALRQVDGVEALDGVSNVDTTVKENAATIVIRDFSLSPDHVELAVTEGEPAEIRRQLTQVQGRNIVVSTVLAERAGLKMGDDVTLDTRSGPKPFHICGITNEYAHGGMALYLYREVAGQYFQFGGADAYIVKAAQGRQNEVAEELKKLCAKHEVLFQTFADVRRIIEGIMGGVVASLWVILLLGFVVAALGIVNTLTMNVLEQTRELGLLRIVAMTRRQVRKMVLSQAVMIGAIGILPGLAAGLAMAWFVSLAMAGTFGHPIKFGWHPLMAAICIAGAFAVILFAAWFPARRATQLDLLQAIKVE